MNAITPNPVRSAVSSTPNDALIPYIRSVEPEPTFIDLLMTLMRYKIVILTCVAMGAGAGIALALYLPRTYAFTTTIEVGTMQQGGPAVEPAEAVMAKITNVFLPAIERIRGQEINEPGFTIGMDIKNPKGTNVVLLISKTSLDHQDEHFTLHRRLSERVIAEHQVQFSLLKTNLALEFDQAERAAAALKEQTATLDFRKKLLVEKRELTIQRMSEIDSELVRKTSNRDTAGKSLSGQDQVLTLMMLDNEMTRERNKRDDMQSQLMLGMKEETEKIAQEEKDLERTKADHQGRINAIKARMAHIDETKVIDEPQRSRNSVGMGKGMIAVIGVVLGLITGIMIAVVRHSLRQRAEKLGLGSAAP